MADSQFEALYGHLDIGGVCVDVWFLLVASSYQWVDEHEHPALGVSEIQMRLYWRGKKKGREERRHFVGLACAQEPLHLLSLDSREY